MDDVTAVTSARVLGRGDGESCDVVLRDGLIERIEPAGSVRSGEITGEVVDGRGHILVPGLIDTHVHLTDHSELDATARAGVTTVVDLGTHPDSLVASLRQRARDFAVSEVFSAGSAASAPGSTQIAMMGFPEESGVDGPDDAERYLQWRVDNDSDLIKIIIEDPEATTVPALSPEALAALVDGAHRRGLLTVAHVVTAQSFARALEAGVDVPTHAPFDRVVPDEVLEGMVERGSAASPTLIMMRTMARARLGEDADRAFGVSIDAVRRMHQAGVSVVAGTDANSTAFAPVPHDGSLHDELALLQEAGLTADRKSVV